VKRELPQVMLEVHTEMLTPAQEEGLIERRLDLGVLRPPVRQEGIVHRPIADERLVVAVPEQHELVRASSVRAEQLRHEGFIMYSAALGSVLNDIVVRTCLDAGYYPHRAYEVTETSAALALVAAGLGIAVLPESIRSAPREGVVCKDLEDAPTMRLDLAWRADDESLLLHNLLDVLERNEMFIEGAA
jgi:DNA-binding transcriptional LysR family regulator